MLSFIKTNFRWLAGGFLLTYCSSFGQTFFISASIAEWQQAFDLSHGEIGRLYMLATLASALCLPFVGRLADSMPERRLIALVIPCLALATVMAAYATSVAILVIAIFLLRLCGQGMMTHIALTVTGRSFEAQRGRAVSLVVLGHQGGEATLPLIFASVALYQGVVAGWLVGTGFLLLVGLPLALWAYRIPRPREQAPSLSDAGDPPATQYAWTRAEVLRDGVFWILLTGVLAPAFVGTTIFYHQDYLTALRGWPPQFYALSLSVVAGTTIVFALIAGALIDRFRASALLPVFLLPLAGACLVLSFDGPKELLLLVMFLLGISYGFSSTLFGALWPEIYGVTHLGAIRSLTAAAMVFATAAGPGLTGTLIDHGIQLPGQLTWIGGYCLLAALAMSVAARKLKGQRRPGKSPV